MEILTKYFHLYLKLFYLLRLLRTIQSIHPITQNHNRLVIYINICTPPLWPQLADLPFVASVLGALFVGVGAGLCVRAGGAPSGDDALAMSICSVTKKDIRWAYLFSDLIVLVLSLTYLTLTKFALSLLTVLLSGQIIGIIQKIGKTPSATPATE